MKINAQSLSQQTADRIYDMIVKEHLYQPGEQLPNELILSETLGISRTTLRDAIRMLTLQGVLEVQRGKGTFVTKDNRIIGNFGLDNFERIRIRLKDLFEMRLLFEPQVAALACRRGTQAEMDAICRQGQRVAGLIEKGIDRTEADQEFHQMIIAAAHNEFLIHLLPMINRAVSESIMIESNGGTLAEDTIRDHALIMEFLQKRDERGVRNAMEIHIHHAVHTLNLNNGREQILP